MGTIDTFTSPAGHPQVPMADVDFNVPFCGHRIFFTSDLELEETFGTLRILQRACVTIKLLGNWGAKFRISLVQRL
jgi:hypothetical protein